jgi:hypothetical protein
MSACLTTVLDLEFLMHIEIVGELQDVETIAVGGRLPSGSIRWAELHWYEAHGIGRKKLKIKRFLEQSS